MALIRATCQDCGDVELRSNDLHIRICRQNRASVYHFRCPQCRMVEVRNAQDEILEVLIAAGVKCREWNLPDELDEEHQGPPITHDDLLDFHEMLSSRDWFSLLHSMTES
jgi:hypothetical protein